MKNSADQRTSPTRRKSPPAKLVADRDDQPEDDASPTVSFSSARSGIALVMTTRTLAISGPTMEIVPGSGSSPFSLHRATL